MIERNLRYLCASEYTSRRLRSIISRLAARSPRSMRLASRISSAAVRRRSSPRRISRRHGEDGTRHAGTPLGAPDQLIERWCRGRIAPQQRELHAPDRVDAAGGPGAERGLGRGGQRESLAGGDRREHRRARSPALERRTDAEGTESVADEPVIPGAVAMSGYDEPPALELRRRDRSGAGQPVAGSREDVPRLAAETDPGQLGRPELRRRDQGVETPVAKVADQPAPVGLHDRQLDGRTLAPEVTEER